MGYKEDKRTNNLSIDEKLDKLPKVVPTAFRDKITGKYVFRRIYLQCDLSRTDVWIYYKPEKGDFPFLLAVGQTFEMALDEMIQYADRLGLNETEPVLIELER